MPEFKKTFTASFGVSTIGYPCKLNDVFNKTGMLVLFLNLLIKS